MNTPEFRSKLSAIINTVYQLLLDVTQWFSEPPPSDLNADVCHLCELLEEPESINISQFSVLANEAYKVLGHLMLSASKEMPAGLHARICRIPDLIQELEEEAWA